MNNIANTGIYDSHTHLNSDQLYPDREQHLADFVDIWGQWLVNIWVNNEWNLRALLISKNNITDCFVWVALWLHPGEISFSHTIKNSQNIQDQIIQLRTLIQKHKDSKHIVAIWECGIDAHYDRDDDIQALQIELFQEQCELARELRLPIVIHSRDDFALTLDVLQKYIDLKIYFHCRWYTPEDVMLAVQTLPHLWIWFCGNTTYPKATPLRESFAKAIQLWVNILLETDAPYLSPQAVRWQSNTPSYIHFLYDWAIETYPDIDWYSRCKKSFDTLYHIS